MSKNKFNFMIRDCDAFIGSHYIEVFGSMDSTFLQLHERRNFIQIHEETLEKILKKLKELKNNGK